MVPFVLINRRIGFSKTAVSKHIFQPAKTRPIIASNVDFISESDHRVCSFIEYAQEYSSDFRNFKNWMVFRLVVKYSIEQLRTGSVMHAFSLQSCR